PCFGTQDLLALAGIDDVCRHRDDSALVWRRSRRLWRRLERNDRVCLRLDIQLDDLLEIGLVENDRFAPIFDPLALTLEVRGALGNVVIRDVFGFDFRVGQRRAGHTCAYTYRSQDPFGAHSDPPPYELDADLAAKKAHLPE